jgi:hypothetical protein
MIRRDHASGDVSTADVHVDEVENWRRAGWEHAKC